jgi:hypothetical protein
MVSGRHVHHRALGDAIFAVACSPDESYFAFGGTAKKVQIREVTTGQKFLTYSRRNYSGLLQACRTPELDVK